MVVVVESVVVESVVVVVVVEESVVVEVGRDVRDEPFGVIEEEEEEVEDDGVETMLRGGSRVGAPSLLSLSSSSSWTAY